MSVLKQIPKFKTADGNMKAFQDAIAKTTGDLVTNSIVNGVLVKDVEFTAGQITQVNHKLGREPKGFVVAKVNAPMMFWRVYSTGKKTLRIKASAANGNSHTFTDGNVNTGTDIIQITDHLFDTGIPVKLSNSGGALPVPFTAGQIYYVIYGTSSTFYLSRTQEDALAANDIDITSAAGGGTHTITKVCTADLWVF